MKHGRVDYDAATGRMRSPPRQVFLELTPRCNLACVHCSKDYGAVSETDAVDMQVSTIDRLMPWLEAADAVNLNIVGEPLIAKSFAYVLERLSGTKASIAFNTNGIALDSRTCELLVRSAVAHVVVSVDGIESNEPIRGVRYELVRERIERLHRARASANASRPEIGIAFTLMRRNRHELPRILRDVAGRIDIEHVHVQPLIVFYEALVDQNPYDLPDVGDVLERARAIAEARGIRFTAFRSTFEHDERYRAGDASPQLGQASVELGCVDPFYEIKVRADGAVQACSFGLEPGLNVNSMELDDVWNHPWYVAIRRRLSAGRFEGKCAECPFVRGSSANQVSPLRPGVRHSRQSRFLSGAVAAVPRVAPPTRRCGFLEGGVRPSNGLYAHDELPTLGSVRGRLRIPDG